jgi:hypothetical protein
VKRGDLVLAKKFKSIGIIVEIFDDLSKDNPWIRVLFTTPQETYQWCKKSGLTVIDNKRGDHDDPLLNGTNESGSL